MRFLRAPFLCSDPGRPRLLWTSFAGINPKRVHPRMIPLFSEVLRTADKCSGVVFSIRIGMRICWILKSPLSVTNFREERPARGARTVHPVNPSPARVAQWFACFTRANGRLRFWESSVSSTQFIFRHGMSKERRGFVAPAPPSPAFCADRFRAGTLDISDVIQKTAQKVKHWMGEAHAA